MICEHFKGRKITGIEDVGLHAFNTLQNLSLDEMSILTVPCDF